VAEAARRQAQQDQEFMDHLRGKLEGQWTVSPHLHEAEVQIQTALLWRNEAARAALNLATTYAATEPRHAAACADLAAVYLDEDSGPWEAREAEVEERWQEASRDLHEKLGV
jgi:hypothetical protein